MAVTSEAPRLDGTTPLALVSTASDTVGATAVAHPVASEGEVPAEVGVSRDELTGLQLPGLSANSLKVESWWAERPLTAWLARRLYDYRHLSEKRGPNTCPWVVAGVEKSRGPDNEPLIAECEPVAVVDPAVLAEVQREVARLGDDWGSLDRR